MRRFSNILAILMVSVLFSGCSINVDEEEDPTLQELRLEAESFTEQYSAASSESAEIVRFGQSNPGQFTKIVSNLRKLDKGLYEGDDARSKVIKHFNSFDTTNAQVFQPIKLSRDKDVQFVVITGNDYSPYWGQAFQLQLCYKLNEMFSHLTAECVAMDLSARKALFSSGVSDNQIAAFKAFSGLGSWSEALYQSSSVQSTFALDANGEGYDTNVDDLYLMPAVSYIMSQVHQGVSVVLIGLGQGAKPLYQLKSKFDAMEVDSLSYLAIGSAAKPVGIENILSEKDANLIMYEALIEPMAIPITSFATEEQSDLGPFLYLSGDAELEALEAKIQAIYDALIYPEAVVNADPKFRATLYHDVLIRTGGYKLLVDTESESDVSFETQLSLLERGPYVVQTEDAKSLPEGAYLLKAKLVGEVGVRTFGLSVICDSYVVNVGAEGNNSTPFATVEKLLEVKKIKGERCQFALP